MDFDALIKSIEETRDKSEWAQSIVESVGKYIDARMSPEPNQQDILCRFNNLVHHVVQYRRIHGQKKD